MTITYADLTYLSHKICLMTKYDRNMIFIYALYIFRLKQIDVFHISIKTKLNIEN